MAKLDHTSLIVNVNAPSVWIKSKVEVTANYKKHTYKLIDK